MATKKFSRRYKRHVNRHNPAWQFLRLIMLNLSGQRCVLFPWLRATQVHHLGYQRLGRELPIIDVVPLSRWAHQLVSLWFLRKPPLRWLVNWILQLCAIGWLGGGLGWLAVLGVLVQFLR